MQPDEPRIATITTIVDMRLTVLIGNAPFVVPIKGLAMETNMGAMHRRGGRLHSCNQKNVHVTPADTRLGLPPAASKRSYSARIAQEPIVY